MFSSLPGCPISPFSPFTTCDGKLGPGNPGRPVSPLSPLRPESPGTPSLPGNPGSPVGDNIKIREGLYFSSFAVGIKKSALLCTAADLLSNYINNRGYNYYSIIDIHDVLHSLNLKFGILKFKLLKLLIVLIFFFYEKLSFRMYFNDTVLMIQ